MTADTGREVVFQARDLWVGFDGIDILKGINLTIYRGEVVAILGANGSGKSTLIRTLVRINTPSRGSVTSPDASQIGFVPQRANAGGGISATALEVVASGLLGKGHLRLPRGWRARALNALNQVGLADRGNTAVVHLSGGQQQRVYIARALVRNPSVLVLDEPLAGVDAASQQQLADVLARLAATGITIVVILHELGALAPLISRAIVLKDGQIVADGPPSLTPDVDSPTHAGVTGHLEDEISELRAALAEHESGFPAFGSQIDGMTKHHTHVHHFPEGEE